MKKILVVMMIAVLIAAVAGCKKTTEEEAEIVPNQGEEVQDVTFKGDDMALNLGALFTGSVENDGTAGANIDLLIKYPDNRDLKTVVIFVGIKNFGAGENADEVIPKFIDFYAAISAELKICVAVPPVHGSAPYDSSLWMDIWNFNLALKTICGSNYVDTWDIPHTSADGIYPDETMNALIKDRVLAVISAAGNAE